MRTATYKSVLQLAATLWCGKPDPDVRTAEQLNIFLRRRAVEFWESFAWPEWTHTEQRFFAPLYDPTVQTPTGEVRYYPAADAYYQSLAEDQLAAPTNLSGGSTAGSYVADGSTKTWRIYSYREIGGTRVYSPDYAEISLAAVGAPVAFTLGWDAATDADGYRLLKSDPTLGWSFNYYLDTTASGLLAVTDSAAALWTAGRTVTPNNRPPVDDNGETDFFAWAEVPPCTVEEWDSAAAYVAGEWVKHPTSLRVFQARVDVAAGLEPTVSVDWADSWGEVFEFFRVIEHEQDGEIAIGECFEVFDIDPRLTCTRPARLSKEIIREGILIRESNTPWLRFRERAPAWEGEVYAEDETYALDDQVYDPTEGDFFKSLVAGNSGNAVTDATKWERIDFPYVLRDAAAQGAYADMIRMDGQHDKFLSEDREARRLLRREFDKLERQQGQHKALPVRTRS